MSEPRDPAPPASSKDRMAFREIFLLHAPPAGSRTLRQFGRYMYEALVGTAGTAGTAGSGGSELPAGPEPTVPARVRALAEDLRFSAQALAALGKERDRAALSPEAAALALKAESWAREVSELVRAIESAAAGGRERS